MESKKWDARVISILVSKPQNKFIYSLKMSLMFIMAGIKPVKMGFKLVESEDRFSTGLVGFYTA